MIIKNSLNDIHLFEQSFPDLGHYAACAITRCQSFAPTYLRHNQHFHFVYFWFYLVSNSKFFQKHGLTELFQDTHLLWTPCVVVSYSEGLKTWRCDENVMRILMKILIINILSFIYRKFWKVSNDYAWMNEKICLIYWKSSWGIFYKPK